MIPKLSNEEVCKIALANRLFVSGWMLNSVLKDGTKGGYYGVKHAAIFLDGKVPIGVAVITRHSDIQVFVRKSRRREGIGSKLVTHLREVMGEEAGRIDAGQGLLNGSKEFWAANNIRMY